MNHKIILTDCDGVLLDWELSFDRWMAEQGHIMVPGGDQKYDISKRYAISRPDAVSLIRKFNESDNIGRLTPLRDAVHYVRKLHQDHGYVFHCITSLTTDSHACALRERNLKNLFGDNIFEKFVFLDTGADKDQALETYRNSGYYWVEDKILNCEVGVQLGLRSILIEHNHNKDYVSNSILRVENWNDIYSIALGKNVNYQ